MRSWSIPAGRLLGVDIRIHFTFLALLVFVWLTQSAAMGAAGAGRGMAVVGIVFGCVVLHEMGHALDAVIAVVDAQVRKTSSGKRSLDDLIFDVLDRRRRGEAVSRQTWVDLLVREAGGSVTRFVGAAGTGVHGLDGARAAIRVRGRSDALCR